MALLGSSLRSNTHWSAPPVSDLARSGGPGARQEEGIQPRSLCAAPRRQPKSIRTVYKFYLFISCAFFPAFFLFCLFRIFFLDFFLGGWSWRTGPLPPLEWTLLMPLVTAVFITLKGAEPSDSHHTGVIGALVYFLAPKTIY